MTAESHPEPLQVAIDIAQERTARRANGVLRITNARRETVLEARDFGLLQRHGGWASVTGRARVKASIDMWSTADGLRSTVEGSEYRAVTVVVEQADPWLPDRASSITLAADGLQATGRGSVRMQPR